MHDRQLKTENIENLTQLWKRMGSRPCPLEGMEKFRISTGWPYRCWAEPTLIVDDVSAMARGIQKLAQDFIVLVWTEPGPLTDQLESILTHSGFETFFDQTAMYLDLRNYPITDQSGLKRLTSIAQQDIQTWASVATRSFQYETDKSIIQKIAVDPDVQLFTAYSGSHPAATAMLFKTGDVVGVHQVGVLPEYRGRGIARKLMQDIIHHCMQMSAKYLTLQASAAGEPLYSRLGFKPQFKIQNYRRIIRVNT